MSAAITKAMRLLKVNRGRLTRQQVRTLRGQVLAGDTASAMRGLQKLLGQRNAKQKEETK